MKALIQRVSHASVSVDSRITGEISHGILLLIGIEKHDTPELLEKMANKILAYRIFSDRSGKMNLNLKEVKGELLIVSQFTLSANTKKGLRPSFSSAATPHFAQTLYYRFIDVMNSKHDRVETGEFGANMQVALLNDGPVTFLLEM